MTKRTIYFLKLWLVALTGLVSIDSLAQSNYELVIEMRDGTKHVAPIAKEWSTIYEQPHMQCTLDYDSDGNIKAIFDVTWADGRIQVNPAEVKRMYIQSAMLQGDVNGDHVVNIVDIVDIINYKKGTSSASFNIKAVDTDGDGEIDDEEIMTIVNNIMSK